MNASKFKEKLIILTKLCVAFTTIFALIILASSDFAPDETLMTVMLSSMIFVAVFFIFFIFSTIIILSFNQQILKSGGTDPAWFWFKGEPPGLEKQRADLKEFIENKIVK